MLAVEEWGCDSDENRISAVTPNRRLRVSIGPNTPVWTLDVVAACQQRGEGGHASHPFKTAEDRHAVPGCQSLFLLSPYRKRFLSVQPVVGASGYFQCGSGVTNRMRARNGHSSKGTRSSIRSR